MTHKKDDALNINAAKVPEYVLEKLRRVYQLAVEGLAEGLAGALGTGELWYKSYTTKPAMMRRKLELYTLLWHNLGFTLQSVEHQRELIGKDLAEIQKEMKLINEIKSKKLKSQSRSCRRKGEQHD